jgi:hypothetical protein
MRATLTFLCCALATSLWTRPVLAQCALCAESVASAQKQGEGDPALAFNSGILFLLGTVLLLFAGLIGFIVHVARTSTQAAAACPPERSN